MSDPELRDMLIDEEKVTPDLEAKYRRKVQDMYEKKLSVPERFRYGFFFLLGLFFFVIFGWAALQSSKELPWMITAGFGLSSLFGVIQMFLTARVLWLGKVDFKWDDEMQIRSAWVFLVIFTTLMLLCTSQMEDQVKANYMLTSVLVFLVMFTGPFIIPHEIKKSELSMRENMLRLEQQLAELSERLDSEQESDQ